MVNSKMETRGASSPMKRLGRSPMIVFACLLAVFTICSYAITHSALDQGPGHGAYVFQTTIGTITGPFTGAISRGFQDCCLNYSFSIVAYCAPILLLGVAAQFFRMPDRKWARATKMTLWATGWLVWFSGGILSFAHALG